MKMQHIIANIMATFVSSYCWTMEINQYDPARSYQGQEITAQTVEQLGPQLPSNGRADFKQWVYNNPDVLPTLTDFNPVDWKRQLVQGRQLLQSKGITNLSKYAYVFYLPTNPQYIIQLSSPTHKMYNLANAAGKSWDYCNQNYIQGKNLEELKDISGQPTYQTVSRKAYWLLFQDALDKIKQQENPLVSTSDTYLVSLDGTTAYSTACDATHVILQEAYDTTQWQPIRQLDSAAGQQRKINYEETKKLAACASDTALKHLCSVITYAKLFDTAPNTLINPSNGQLRITDLEQPNDKSPFDFFHQKWEKYQHSMACGLEGEMQLFGEYAQLPDKTRIVVDYTRAVENQLPSQLQQEVRTKIKDIESKLNLPNI